MIQYISKPFKWFFKLEAASGLILLIAAILALFISNSNLSSLYFETLEKYLFIGINEFGLKLSVHHWINDALMAIFFFFVTLEIKREFLQGELSNIKQALLPNHCCCWWYGCSSIILCCYQLWKCRNN
jgi:NhaA family Na+:H+ antiporter